jgi:hypothetical protein
MYIKLILLIVIKTTIKVLYLAEFYIINHKINIEI